MSVNGGNQTVPTVQFPDGSALTNPSIIDVKQHLAAIAGPVPSADVAQASGVSESA